MFKYMRNSFLSGALITQDRGKLRTRIYHREAAEEPVVWKVFGGMETKEEWRK